MATTTFPLFQRLPTELRLQIWRETLPERLGNPLYFYKKGCWEPRYLTEADWNYDPNDTEYVTLEFLHDRLDPLQVEVPLFYVNREARSFALEWVSRQGLKARFNKEKQSLVFIRPFDPGFDTVFVSQEKWHEFICEPWDRMFAPEFENTNYSSPGPVFTRLTIPDEVLLKESNALEELFDYYRFDQVFIILSVQSDGSWCDLKHIGPQELWELETIDVQWPSFCWNSESESFEWKNDQCKDDDRTINNYPLYRVLQEASSGLRTKLLEWRKERFEIFPVFAVRK